jgi:hypothetical protein
VLNLALFGELLHLILYLILYVSSLYTPQNVQSPKVDELYN